ncbi:hypothetical protein ACH5RR_009176 [Cinchona calisaya]|uniref:Uncharacterized protein n=1 Tax=Cinchona calisaya TaxID=153742 RepID=A0ABD3ADV2_9GENT
MGERNEEYLQSIKKDFASKYIKSVGVSWVSIQGDVSLESNGSIRVEVASTVRELQVKWPHSSRGRFNCGTSIQVKWLHPSRGRFNCKASTQDDVSLESCKSSGSIRVDVPSTARRAFKVMSFVEKLKVK